MWNDSFNNSFSRRRRNVREYDEIVEIIASGRTKIMQKDINSQLMELWDAGLIADKDGKYKNGKATDVSEDDVEGSTEPRYRKILRIME